MQPLTEAYYNSADTQGKAAATMHQWVEDYLHEAKQQDRSDEERRRLMNATNPKYLLRNYLAQLAIDDAEKVTTNRWTLCWKYCATPMMNSQNFKTSGKKAGMGTKSSRLLDVVLQLVIGP